jgi:predicted glycosyltransferase
MSYVGFLQRAVPHSDVPMRMPEGDYILVTTGGGGDGAELIHNVLDAYRSDNRLQHKALVVLGPFMPVRKRRKLMRKAQAVPQVNMIEFDNRLETLMAGSRGVVGMGGYNTFCEILSFDKPAIIVPRLQPREEQFIRAKRAAELGIIEMVLPEQAADPEVFAAALAGLAQRPPPSLSGAPVALNGLENITNLVGDWLEHRSQKRFSVVEN